QYDSTHSPERSVRRSAEPGKTEVGEGTWPKIFIVFSKNGVFPPSNLYATRGSLLCRMGRLTANRSLGGLCARPSRRDSGGSVERIGVRSYFPAECKRRKTSARTAFISSSSG